MLPQLLWRLRADGADGNASDSSDGTETTTFGTTEAPSGAVAPTLQAL